MIRTLFIVTMTLLSLVASGESVVESISQQRDWRAEKVSEHRATGKDACLASTSKDQARLEIYAEVSISDGFIGPSIHVSLPAGDTNYIGGTMTFGGGAKFDLSRLSANPDGEYALYATRLGDRERIIGELKRGLTATVVLLDSNGERAQYAFSLRGSSNTISNTFRTCDLSL